MPRPLAIALFIGLGAALTAMAACDGGGTESEAPGTISGTVSVEGEPLADVTVELSGAESRSTTPDGSGSFTFDELPAGSYEVGVSDWPAEVTFQDPDEVVSVESGATTSVAFSGSYVRTASIRGSVEIDGDQAQGVEVSLSGMEERQTTTDASGLFVFDQLRSGDYTVSISGPGEDVVFDSRERSVSVEVGGQASVIFEGETLEPVQVEVPHVEKPNTSLRFNLEAVSGEADVIVEVDPGSQIVTRVRLFLAGERVATRTFPEGLREEAELEMRVNTAAFDPSTGEPRFENGPVTIQAHVDTEEEVGVATGTLEVTLANRDRIAGVSATSVGEGVVSNGRRWYGDRDLHFEVVPVLYDPDRVIGAISLQATGDASVNGGPSLDLGSGHGQPHTVEGPPFVFTASLADNAGEVEDDSDGRGHSLRVVEVFNGEGVEITTDFIPGRTSPLEGFFVDFVAPQVPSGAAISIGGQPVAAGEWLSSGDFKITNLTEGGSGGTVTTFQVDDGEENSTRTNVEAVADLPEGGNGRYEARVTVIRDAMGNSTDGADFPPATPSFGVDRTAVNVTQIQPESHLVLNPTDTGGDGSGDNGFAFTAEDPSLPDGSTASGYARSTAEATTADGETSITITPSISPNSGGVNTIGSGALGENRWTVRVTTVDGARPANETVFSYDVTIDKTAPAVTLLDTPASSVNVSGTVTFTIGGQITDENGVGGAFIRVRNGDDNDPAVCEENDALYTVGTGPGQVSSSQIDITQSAGDFEAQVTVHAQASGSQQDICFAVETADVAKDRFGNLEPNRSVSFARTIVNWN